MCGAVVGSLTFGIELRLMCLCLRSGQALRTKKQNRTDRASGVERRLGNMHSGQSQVAQLKSSCCLHQMYLPSHCIVYNNKCKRTLLYLIHLNRSPCI